MTLNEKEYFQFIETHHELLLFAGAKHGLINKSLTCKAFLKLKDFKLKFICREKLNSDSDIFDEYLAHKGRSIKESEAAIVNGFRNKITSDFIVFRSLKKHTIFIDKKKIYGVVALWDPFTNLIEEFPSYLKTTILQFNDKIIYDGFLESYPIHFGKNIRTSLNQQYKEAKKNGEIISQLTQA